VSAFGWVSDWLGGGGRKDDARRQMALLGSGLSPDDLAEGVRFLGLGWSHAELKLSLRCADLLLLPRSLRVLAASRMRELGLQEEARALLTIDEVSASDDNQGGRGGGSDGDGSGGIMAGWFADCVIVYVHDTSASSRCHSVATSCAPIRTELYLHTLSPGMLHSRGLWVPDFASSASVHIVLPMSATSAAPASSRSGGAAAVEFGVERGGMQQAHPGGMMDPPAGLAVHPWWCVCRQGLSAFDVGEAAIPLLDAFSDQGFLGSSVETAITMLSGDVRSGGDGSEPWRVAFRG